MKKVFLFILFCLTIITLSCNRNEEAEQPCDAVDIAYYSDYFVFISSDTSNPLVIPMDFNWRPEGDGFRQEFKGWYGTQDDWPIRYLLNSISSNACAIPQEVWLHPNNDYFLFDEQARSLQVKIDGAPTIFIIVPDSSKWIVKPDQSSSNQLIGMKSTAIVGGEIINGWLVYERIRRLSNNANSGLTVSRDFASFYWMPFIVDDHLYFFKDHRGQQSAARWKDNNGTIEVDTLDRFEFKVLKYSTDSTSGRSKIPESLSIKSTAWGVDAIFKSTGAQVGYGDQFPNGLAYYRQSLLESVDSSKSKGYGMLELILEDD